MRPGRPNPSRAVWLALSAAIHLALAVGFVRFAVPDPDQPVMEKIVAVSLVTLPPGTADRRSRENEPAKRPVHGKAVQTAATIRIPPETLAKPLPANVTPGVDYPADAPNGRSGRPWPAIRMPPEVLLSRGPMKAEAASTGPGSVSGRADPAIPPGWLSEVRSRIERAKRYPWSARVRGLQGTSLVRFQVASDGAVRGVGILRSSAYEILDDAAVRTVERAAPFPSPPAELAEDDIEIDIPLVFELH